MHWIEDSAQLVSTSFAELGHALEARWRARHYRDEDFAALAEETLRASTLRGRVGAAELYAWSLTSALPPQLDVEGTFGEPPLTVFAGSRFVIDAYSWFSSTTAIHQHAFTGAFMVLQGGSVHSRYRFEEHDRFNARLQRGELVLAHAEVLRPGDVRRIEPGRAGIHALFHLEHPSISIVVRTSRDDQYAPQYSYLPPGIAYDPFFVRGRGARGREVREALAKVDLDRYEQLIARQLGQSDASDSFFLLREVFWTLLKHPERFARARDLACDRHGARFTALLPVFERMLRDRWIVATRKRVEDPALRTFLALLLNVPHGADIERLVTQHFPGEPARQRILGWIEQLGELTPLGFALDEVQRDVFASAVGDSSWASVRRALAETYEPAELEAQRPQIERFLSTLRQQPLIAPLFH